MAIVAKLYDAFVRFDAMLCEVNPLIVTPEGEVKALDSKFTVDDNALFRHPDVAEMRDVEAADPRERLAREKDVTYVKLDGEIGILGNGAGLVMATLDVIDQEAAGPRTSAISAAAATHRASSMPWRSSCRTSRSRRSSSTSSGASRAATRSRAGSSRRSAR